MAGHSKWKQIKHKKAAADVKRAALFGKYSRAISAASREAKGDTSHPTLASVIERARDIDMSKESIDKAVKKGIGATGPLEESLLFETYGPGGVAVVFTVLADSRNRAVQELKHILSGYGAVVGGAGSALWAFENPNTGMYVAREPITLEGSTQKAFKDFLEAVESYTDVQEVFYNCALGEEDV
jgi:transcriptional/translational regulatory protein YebC/TACO1